MAGGAAIAVDRRANDLRLIEPDGRDRSIGGTGGGPGEFRGVRTVFSWSGDTAAVHDRRAGRLIFVTTAGMTDQTVPLPEEAVSWGTPRAGDDYRNVYFAHGEARDAGYPDKVPVIRWNATTGDVDTVALVLAPGVVSAKRETSPGTRVNLIVPKPFHPRDLWTAFPTGDVVILRCCDTLRFERVTDGEHLEGPAYLPPPGQIITEADRELYEAMDYLGHEWEWPERRPPIANEGLVVATDSSIWVRLTLEAGDATQYAEFSFDGRRRRVHRFPDGRYVVAVDRARILAVRRDEMDLHHLEIYRR